MLSLQKFTFARRRSPLLPTNALSPSAPPLPSSTLHSRFCTSELPPSTLKLSSLNLKMKKKKSFKM